MKLWKRASGALKDQKSILRASLTSRSGLRNTNIETTVIKATTHGESRVDYHSIQRVFAWVKISDDSLHHVLWVLFRRMKTTCNWVVTLKGLMLLHGVFCCKVPGIQEIERLPFDLINLKDKHTKHEKMLGLNNFICAYYAFLDEKSSFIFLHSREQTKRRETLPHDEMNEEQKQKLVIQDFIWLQKLQGLLDTLLEIQLKSSQPVNMLVLEAMDCIVIEVFDIYGRICNGIGTVIERIYSAGIGEAKMALSILHKAKVQNEELWVFLDFCRDIGVGNASHCPNMEQVPEESIRELEDIISGVSEIEQFPKEEEKRIIVVEKHTFKKKHDDNNRLKTDKQ
nr:putative clathrin assembly protein At1g25240 [Tanacetum cinerariifolium]